MEQENKKSELRKLSNQKYYNKKKQEQETEIKTEPIINKKECIKENIKPLEEDSSDWSDWLYDTGKGAFQMIMSTLIQSGATLILPLIISILIPRPGTNSTIMPSTSTSAQQPRQQQEHTDQQQTVSSLSQLM